MYAFTFEKPSALAQATSLLRAGGKALAGGQTLLASMKMRLANPEQLVDLKGLPGLSGIRSEGNALVIGSMTTHAEVAESALVRSTLPALADLAGGIGDRQVRALGTMGGSVANNDPAACYPAAVLALGATVHTDKRRIAAAEFFQGMFTTALDDGEIVTAISFPVPRRAAYMKFRQPASRFALIGVFVAQTDAGARVAVTGGGNGVFRHAGLESALSGRYSVESAARVSIDPDDFAGDLHASAQYRAQLVSVLTQRAVARSLG